MSVKQFVMQFEFKATIPPSEIPLQNWNSWTWQLQNALKNHSDFARKFALNENEAQAFSGAGKIFSVRATPYYASLTTEHPEDPLRRILMPRKEELEMGAQAQLDPLGERKNNPVSRIIHRYPDRVLFLVTDICSVYCRYCTRKHFTGQEQAFLKPDEFKQAIAYIRSKPGIREVILSGGDPLTLSDGHLDRVLGELRAIPHVEIIRVGTRMPVVCPMRVTENLAKMFRSHKPVYLMTHFNHPRELTLEAKNAVEMFVDHGVPVFNQMVLLNGVNNHPAIVQALSRRLLYLRAKPYYMFQCDPSEGTDHLRTSIEESMQIQRELWGTLSGLAMPNLSLDIPDGGGKAALVPEFEIGRTPGERTYRGWDGVVSTYKNPQAQKLEPIDAHLYVDEWNEVRSAKKDLAKTCTTLAQDERILPQTF